MHECDGASLTRLRFPPGTEGDMDLSALPNNNHPDKFLQLDVKLLMRNSALLQAGLARFPGGNFPAAQNWQNLVYSQVPSGRTWARVGAPFFLALALAATVQKEDCRERRTEQLLLPRGKGLSSFTSEALSRHFVRDVSSPPVHSPPTLASQQVFLVESAWPSFYPSLSGFFKPICK